MNGNHKSAIQENREISAKAERRIENLPLINGVPVCDGKRLRMEDIALLKKIRQEKEQKYLLTDRA